MLRGEILPALPLAEQLFKLVIADPATAFGSANTSLFQGGGGRAGDIAIDDAPPTNAASPRGTSWSATRKATTRAYS